MSIIIYANKDGVELFYDNRITKVVGSVEMCIDYIIRFTCDVAHWRSAICKTFEYKSKQYELLTDLYVDTNGFGMVYSDQLIILAIPHEKVITSKVDLRIFK